MNKDDNNDLKKKVPYLSNSPLLFDEFLILGYSEMEQNRIIERIKNNTMEIHDHIQFSSIQNTSNNTFLKNDIPFFVLSSISNPNKPDTQKMNMLHYSLFPNSLPIIFSNQIGENQLPEYNSIFSFNSDAVPPITKTLSYGYAYAFYEKSACSTLGKAYYFPKAICFISPYPFFSHYYDLAQMIRGLFNNLKAPVELILYNLINYSVAPINLNVKIEWIPSMFKADLSKTQASLQCLSGFPIVDMDIEEIFAVLPVEMIVKLYLFSLLECQILLFSENLEVLNCIMYIISALHFPCTDTIYSSHLMSISVRNLSNDDSSCTFSEKASSSILGVNCGFNPELSLEKFIKGGLLIVDIDNKEVLPKNLADNYYIFYRYFNDLLSRPIIAKNPLEENIHILLQKLEEHSKNKALRLGVKANKGGRLSFIKSMSPEIQSKNKKIQELFYSFVLNILKPFYSFIALEKDLAIFNEKRQKQNSFVIKEKPIKSDFELFNDQLSETVKMSTYFVNYLNFFEACDFYSLSYNFTDVFLQMNNSISDEYSIPHLKIIDSFFQPKNKQGLFIILGRYNNIIKEDSESKSLTYCTGHLIQRLSSKVELKSSSFLLFNNILSSVGIDRFSIDKGLEYAIIEYSDLSQHTEEALLNEKLLGYDYIIWHATIVLSIFTIEFINMENMNQLIQLVIELLIHKEVNKDKRPNPQFFIKNISMFLKILYHYISQPIRINVNNQFLWRMYHQLLEVLILFKTRPNEDLFIILTQMNKCDNSLIKNEFILDECFIELIKSKMNPHPLKGQFSLRKQQTMIEVKREIPYITRLIQNKCKDGTTKVETVFKEIDSISSNANIQMKCNKCNKQLQLKILFKTRLVQLANHGSLEVDIFSPTKIYSLVQNLMKTWVSSQMSYESLDRKIIQQLVVNLLLYHSRIELKYSMPIIQEWFI